MNTDHQARFDCLYAQHLRALKRHGKAVKTIEAYGLAVRRRQHHQSLGVTVRAGGRDNARRCTFGVSPTDTCSSTSASNRAREVPSRWSAVSR